MIQDDANIYDLIGLIHDITSQRQELAT